MSENPFEAPRYVESPPSAPIAARFDVRKTIGDAWRAVIGDLGVVIIASVIFLSTSLAAILTVLGFFLFFPVLLYGGVKLVLNLQDGIAGYTDLGDAFPKYWSALGDMLLMMLFQSMVYLPCWVLAFGGEIIGIRSVAVGGQLAALAVAALLVSRFVFAPFYLVDSELGAAEAMRASWAATSEQKLMTLLLIVASAVIASLGVACGFGALVSIPMSYVMFASAYRQMNPRRTAPR